MAEYIKGQKVSSFDQISSFEPSDLFMISRPKNTYCLNYYESDNISYSRISSEMMQMVLEKLDLKSMAWEDENDYARINHTHDYSNVIVNSHYTNGSLYNDLRDSRLSVLANVKINGRNNPISFPKFKEKVEYKTPIGTLKFLAVPKLNRINVQDFNFDGWVYPDGRLLKKEDFPDAYEEFGDYYKIETDPQEKFRIPTLSNFIELNPFGGQLDVEAIKELPYQVGMSQHRHGYNLKTTGNIRTPVKIFIGDENWNESGIHKGDIASGYIGSCSDSIIMLSSDNLMLDGAIEAETSIQGTDEEQYPNHNLLPVLMYIGKNEQPTGETDCRFQVVDENNNIITIDNMFIDGQWRNSQYIGEYIYVDVEKNVEFELKMQKRLYHEFKQKFTFNTLNDKVLKMQGVSLARFTTVNGIIQGTPKIDIDQVLINDQQVEFMTEGVGINVIALEKNVPEFQITIKKDGFYDYTGKYVYNTPNNAVIILVPVGQTRAVLTWGEEPRDLDSHCLQYQENTKLEHCFYRKRSTGNMELDVDDTSGYGPETTTIKDEYFSYNYVFRVHLYAGVGSISSGNPVVTVYGKNGQQTINCPSNINGNWWNVFKIVGGNLTVLNTSDHGAKGSCGCTDFPPLSHF